MSDLEKRWRNYMPQGIFAGKLKALRLGRQAQLQVPKA
jgi:hypothetical protein